MTDDNRLGPPPVEPMSDVAWSRIERGLWSRMDGGEAAASPGRTPRVLRRWWIVAPLAAAAAVVALVLATRASHQEIAIGDEPARVVSGSAPSSVSFGDAHIELAAATAVVMSHEPGTPTGNPIVLLERGAAWFTVAPRKQRPEFIVRAGDATVRVVGTRFRVARSDERITVAVERGLVDVQFRGSVLTVDAGQSWSSESPEDIATLAATPAPAGPIASAEPSPAPPLMAPVPGTTPPPASEPTPAPSKPTSSEPTFIAPQAPKSGARPEPKPGARPDLKSEPKPGARPEPKSELTSEPTHVTDAERVEYDRLAALEPNDPAAALAGYLTLARGTSRWADLALFAAARLAVDRHDRRAETLLDIYLQRFPNGANAADARNLLARLKSDRP